MLFVEVLSCSTSVTPDIADPLCCMSISAAEQFFKNHTLPASPAPRPAVVKFCVVPEVRRYVVFAPAGMRAVVPAACKVIRFVRLIPILGVSVFVTEIPGPPSIKMAPS